MDPRRITSSLFKTSQTLLSLPNQLKIQCTEFSFESSPRSSQKLVQKDFLMVHGVNFSGALWYKFAQELIELAEADTSTRYKFRCVMPTLPLGAHTIPLPLSMTNSISLIVDSLYHIAKECKLEKAILFGNDTGGALCQVFLSKYSSEMGGLVLTNCDSYEDFFPIPLSLLHYAAFVPCFGTLVKYLMKWDSTRRVVYGVVSRKAWKQEGEMYDFVKEMASPLFEPSIQKDYANVLQDITSVHTMEAAKAFPSFDKPVLVAWTSERDWFFKEEMAKRLVADFPKALLRKIPNSKTIIPLDNPSDLAQCVLEFVNGEFFNGDKQSKEL